MSEVNMETAKAMYGTVCSALDEMNLNYRKFEEDLVITFGYKGQDMNHDVIIIVNAEREVIQLVEKLPFEIDENKAADVSRAVCYANQYLVSGRFIYNMKDEISFKLTQFYAGSLIGHEVIKNMIIALAVTVEGYDDKFMALNKGYLKPEDFAD